MQIGEQNLLPYHHMIADGDRRQNDDRKGKEKSGGDRGRETEEPSRRHE